MLCVWHYNIKVNLHYQIEPIFFELLAQFFHIELSLAVLHHVFRREKLHFLGREVPDLYTTLPIRQVQSKFRSDKMVYFFNCLTQ